jgi:hypothetical protein
MTMLLTPTLHSPAIAVHQPGAGLAVELARYVRSSRAIASMLPPLLSSGALTLVVTAAVLLTGDGWTSGFFTRWLESWLIAWPIVFPAAYVSRPVLARLAAFVPVPAVSTVDATGLAWSDIAEISARVTAQNGFPVLHNLKPAQDFSAA